MQVFPKSANYWSRGSIIALLFVLAGLGWMILTIQRSDFVTTANQFIEQPVQFSHQHHAGGIGIDCRYCHTSVEISATAGIPPTKTCINCHRDPAQYVRPRDQVTTMGYKVAANTTQAELGAELVKAYNISGIEHMTSCSVCHR